VVHVIVTEWWASCLFRSLCSLVCKWSFEADGKIGEWNTKFFHEIGLEDLTSNGFVKIGLYVGFLIDLIS
jgi:ribulose kinase